MKKSERDTEVWFLFFAEPDHIMDQDHANVWLRNSIKKYTQET